MKKTFLYLLAFALIGVMFSACSSDDDKFDEGLLIGKWKSTSGNEYYKYLADYTGSTWDEDDDVMEDEAQKFTWQLVKSELQQIHIMEIGGSVPKYYTVTELTNKSLKYKDPNGGKSFSYTKVN